MVNDNQKPLVQHKDLPAKKEFRYKDPQINLGKGKFGPVDLIIVDGQLRALKKIKKCSIDDSKRIEHVKQEK